jgi:hypothetical protein
MLQLDQEPEKGRSMPTELSAYVVSDVGCTMD